MTRTHTYTYAGDLVYFNVVQRVLTKAREYTETKQFANIKGDKDNALIVYVNGYVPKVIGKLKVAEVIGMCEYLSKNPQGTLKWSYNENYGDRIRYLTRYMTDVCTIELAKLYA